jgi:hypothetical protein
MVFNNTTPTNWNNYFIAMAGTVDATTDRFIKGQYIVFKGHLDGSAITIDELAPGYTDAGNKEDDVIVLKPTTLWADLVADAANKIPKFAFDSDADLTTTISGDIITETDGVKTITTTIVSNDVITETDGIDTLTTTINGSTITETWS